mmetsp:Transcript_14990/g.18487  ORF Transcript_14990/g.18487 Transcript_14990/m.18487 type:complete len:195 (+) Transcript_14990:245-829(+)
MLHADDDDDEVEFCGEKKAEESSDDVIFICEREADPPVDFNRYGQRTHTQIRLKDKFVPVVIDLPDSQIEEWFNKNAIEHLASVKRGLERHDLIARLLEIEDISKLTIPSKKDAQGVTAFDKVRIDYTIHLNPVSPYYLLETSASQNNKAMRVEYAGFTLLLSLSPSIVRVREMNSPQPSTDAAMTKNKRPRKE